jgi:O-antigen/teichoic acid export membrane protein
LAAGIFLVSDQAVDLVFGPGFENAGIVLRVLSFIIAVSFCNNVNGAILNAMGRERLFAALSAVSVVLVTVLNWVLIQRFSYVVVAITQVIGVGLGFIVYSFLCHSWLKLALPWKTALKALTAALIMTICVFYSLQMGVYLPAVILIIGPVTYGGALYILKALSTEDVLFLKRVIRLA